MARVRQIRDATPVLLVSDVKRSGAYYAEKLGFRVKGLWGGDPPMFGVVERDDVRIMLNGVTAGTHFHPNGDYDGRYDVYLDVADADALYAEFVAAGADVVCPPEDQIYDMREFSVRDPDGRLLAFGHDISKGA